MQEAAKYIPIDRRLALATASDLPERASGAVLFADISGFTPLTEGLVNALGARRGAEELTHWLNLVYDALITQVHRYHGSVMGFSGDAIICWFAQDSGLQAVTCALMMQEAMQEFASVKIPSGAVLSLSVKLAVATGPVRRFLVGDAAIQVLDVLVGSTLDHVATTEKNASKGEVVLTAQAAAALGSNLQVREWREDAQTGACFAVVSGLAHPASPTPWDASITLAQETVRPWLLPPVYTRLMTHEQGLFLAEMRPAVALFLRFSGIDYDNDAEAGARLDAYICRVQQILARYEGFLLQVTMGDKGSYLYAAFGAPIAHDDDPARAVAAAFELLALQRELPFIAPVQIGISRGQMRTGAYGGTQRRTYGVLGDEVNLAARLMTRAEPGTILVSPRIANKIADHYHLHSLGAVQLKGKREPITIAQVLGRQLGANQQLPLSFSTPLLGRDKEMAWLQQHLDEAIAGQGQLVRLEGGAGMGKSHLSTAFCERAAQQGMHVLRGACQISSRETPYIPWQHILRPLLGLPENPGSAPHSSEKQQLEALLHSINPGWLLRLPLLGDILDLPIADNPTTALFDARQRQEALFSLVVDIIGHYASRAPLLLLFEDIHWIDEASRGLITSLSRVLNRMPLLLLLVHRPPLDDAQPILPELNPLPYHHHLALGELPPEGVRDLVVASLQGPPSPLVLSLIQSQSQGNPFFVEELVDTLCEAGKLYQRPNGTWYLSDAVINALRQAQCITRDEQRGEWVLASDAQLSAAALGIPESVYSAVLSRMDRLPESHKLSIKVASVIGRVFAFNVLMQAHPARPTTDLLVQQFSMIGERDFVQIEVTLPALIYMFKHHITQEVAYGTLLDSQQRLLHGKVAEVLEELQPEAVEQLAYHYNLSDAYDKAVYYLDAAARKLQREYANETALYYYQQALAREERWEWRRGQVEILHILGRREAEQEALRALETAPDAPAFEVARLWGQYYESIGSYPEALAAIERALAVQPDAPECYLLGTSCYYLQGELDTALEWARRGLAMAEQVDNIAGQAQARKWIGIILDDQGHLAQGIESQEESARLLEQINHLSGLITALNSLGILYHNAGRWEEAIDRFTRSIQLSETIGDTLGSARASMNLGLLYSDRGEPQRANELYLYSAEQFQRIGSELGLGLVTANRGELMLVQGRPQEAIDLLLESVAILERINARIDLPELLWTAAEAALQLDDAAQATRHARRALDIALELGVELSAAVVRRVLAQIALHQQDYAAAQEAIASSLEALRRLGHRYELGRALYWQARVAHASGQPAQAQEIIAEARQVFEALKAQRDLALVAELEAAMVQP